MEHEILLCNHSRKGFFVHLEIDLRLNFEIYKVPHFCDMGFFFPPKDNFPGVREEKTRVMAS